MAFASSETIKDRFRQQITGFTDARVKHGAYELSLGAEATASSNETIQILDEPRADAGVPKDRWEGGLVNVMPGQLAMLLTEEVVTVPDGYLGLISIKAGIKLSGLVNVSGFHVDPGFTGRIKFTVYNAGGKPVPLRRGAPTFLIWFAAFDRETEDLYNGPHNGQRHISRAEVAGVQGELASPSSLDRRLTDLDSRLESEVDKLRDKLSTLQAVLFTLGIGILLLLFRGVLGEGPQDPPVPVSDTLLAPLPSVAPAALAAPDTLVP